jgi:hypothetical protein
LCSDVHCHATIVIGRSVAEDVSINVDTFVPHFPAHDFPRFPVSLLNGTHTLAPPVTNGKPVALNQVIHCGYKS